MQVSTRSEEARAAFFMAWDEGNRGNRSRASVLATEAVRMDPGFGLARVLHSRVAPGAINTQERTDDMDRGVSDAALGSLAEGYVARAIREMYSAAGTSMFPSASQGLDGLLSGRPLLNSNLARINARQLLDSVMQFVPDDPYVAYLRLALADPVQLDEGLVTMVRRFPEFPIAHHTMALRRQLVGDTSGAEAAMREYVRRAPLQAHAHYSLGAMLIEFRRPQDALAHYQQALNLDSTSALHWAGVGEVSSLLGNHAAATTHLRRAVQIAPANADGYTLLAEAHLRAALPDSAIAVYRTLLQLQPGSAAAYGGIAGVYVKMERYDEASATYREQAAAAVSPMARNPAQRSAALVHVLAGEPARAVSALQELVADIQQSDSRGGVVQYRDMALIEATFGDRAQVPTLLQSAERLVALIAQGGGGTRPANQAPPLRAAALAHALSGSIQEARRIASQLEPIAAAVGATAVAQYHEILAVVAVSEGDLIAASEQLSMAGKGALVGWIVYAEALNRAGRTDEAARIAGDLLAASYPAVLTPDYVIAIAKAKALL
jgi:tetratricopeptide (TPR) repeat protein